MRKLFSYVMLMAVGLLISGNAGANTLTVGTSDATYQTIAAALEQASEGDEIQLLTDINEAVTINKAITLDLNGKKLYNYDHEAVLTLNATEILVKNGIVETFNQYLENNENVNAIGIVIGDEHHAKLLDVTVTAKEDKPYYGVDVRENASLDIENGSYEGYYALVLGQENEERGLKAYRVGNVHIYGNAEFYTVNRCEIQNATDAYLVISGNTTWTGEAGILGNGGRLLIEGGTFISKTTYTICTWSPFYVTGGIFISAPESTYGCIANYGTKYIKGGYFSVNDNLHATGFQPQEYINEEGRTLYHVVRTIAQIEGKESTYGSIQEAIAVAEENDQIQIATNCDNQNTVNNQEHYWDGAKVATRPYSNDVTEDFVVSGKKIKFNNNGRNFTGKITANNNATVHIFGANNVLNTIELEKDATSEIKVISGIYASEPTGEYLMEGAKVTPLENGTFKVESYVAQIGNDKYLTLKAAVEAANSMDDDASIMIKLLMDADDSGTSSDGLKIQKSMTIDLAGNTIYQKDNHSGTRGIFYVTGEGNVMIKDGTIKGKDNDTYGIQYAGTGSLSLIGLIIQRSKGAAIGVASTGKVTIASNCQLNGVGSIKVSTNSFNIDNAAQLGEVNIDNYSGTIVNSGTLTLTGNTTNVNTLTIENTGTITINKGTFANTFTFTDNKVGTIAINGGYFTDAAKTSLDGKVVLGDRVWTKTYRSLSENVEYWTVMSEAEMQCYIGEDQEHKYTLLDAINKIADKSTVTITLCNNVIVEDTQFKIDKEKNITIDLQGYYIKGETYISGKGAFFNCDNATLTLKEDDNKLGGYVEYNNMYTFEQNAYTINLSNASFNMKNCTIKNLSASAPAGYPSTLCLNYSSNATIENGNIEHLSKKGHACRLRPNCSNDKTYQTFNFHGGEIKGLHPIYINLENNGAKPHVTFNMTGGRLIATDDPIAIYSTSLSSGATFDNVVINITGGEIEGLISLGGGVDEARNVIETVDVAGGLYSLHRALRPQKRSAETRIQYISGGAYYFDYVTNADDKHNFSEFCEYIKLGHYALKMHMVEETTDCSMVVNGKTYYFAEGEAEDGSFWAVIDGKGTFTPLSIIESKELKQTDINPNQDLEVSGNNTQVTIPINNHVAVNRVDVGTGAGIIVKTGATLDVGAGGIVVNGSSTQEDIATFIQVEPGGKVITDGTIVSSKVEEIRVLADGTKGSGVVLISPDVTFNQQPKSTVEMYTYARFIEGQNKYIWQHFGIPTLEAPLSIVNNRSCHTQYWQWNYEEGDWEQVNYATDKAVNTPFRGYNIKTDYQGTDGVIYTFTGNILGNGDASLSLKPGFNFYANSYLAPINAQTLIDEIEDENVEWTVWMYNGETDNFDIMNNVSLLFGEACEIPALRGFFLKLSSGSESSAGINYESTVWNNAMGNGGAVSAPAREIVANNVSRVKISLLDNNGKGDVMYLAQSDNFDAGFNNGYDATKQMSDESANLYAETMAGDLAIVATDDLDGLYLSMNTKGETAYTMTFSHQNGEAFELVDLFNHRSVLMTEGATYTFTAPENADMSNRFQIRKTTGVVTGTESIKADASIKNGIYTPLGQYVGNVNRWAVLPTGMYIINGEKVMK